jgi:hypothetical protein
MERQKHGFMYQENVCKRNQLIVDENYTGIWDAYTDMGVPCMIKTFKKGSEIPLSDIFINSRRDKDFYLIYGIWQNKKTNIVEEKKILVDIQKWKELFDWDYYDDFKFWIKNIVSNNLDYDETWKSELKKWKKNWGKDRLIQPRFKRDHKKQKRIQSAVPNKKINEFINYVKK